MLTLKHCAAHVKCMSVDWIEQFVVEPKNVYIVTTAYDTIKDTGRLLAHCTLHAVRRLALHEWSRHLTPVPRLALPCFDALL